MAGVAIMQKKHPHINSLRDANRSMLEESKTEMDQTVYNRCSFSIDENQRVLNMVDAFNRNDLEKVGTILYEAHEGISKLYEVSCSESDFLVAYAKKNSQVLGARQTGGGFGGCTLNLVHEDAIEEFIRRVSKAYKMEFNTNLEAFEVKPSGGNSII